MRDFTPMSAPDPLPPLPDRLARSFAGVALIAALLSASLPAMAEDASREAKIKAAVVSKTIKFVEWPATAFAGASAPLTLCLVGSDVMDTVLKSAEQLSAHGHPVQFRQVSYAKGRLEGCHVVFIARGETERLSSILADTAGSPMLTISDIPEFAKRGGTIGLVQVNNRLGFEINLKAARQVGLTLSAPLLELATVVE